MKTAPLVPNIGSSPTDAISYTDLYARWEKGNWSAMEIDFTQDRIDWHEKFTDEQRRGALWLYTLFFHGEDSVADNLSPYIEAAPLEEQKYFLTTQQVDEARHAVFFKRFMEEVVGLGDDGGSIAGALRASAPQLTWGHRQVFGRLDRMAHELHHDRSPAKLASAITLYHIIVEASLAQPGQHMIESSLEELDVLPGFRAGMRNVALDEQRHIGFGVKLLSDLYRADPEPIQEAIVSTLREVMPWSAGVAIPPGWDMSYLEAFGFSLEDLYTEGAMSMESKLRAVGLDVEHLPRFPLPMDVSPRERARTGLLLFRAGMGGPREGPTSRDPEATAAMFDSLRCVADTSAVPPGTAIGWDFTDAPPWTLTMDNGATRVEPRLAPDADLVLTCGFEDWVDVYADRVDPRVLLLKRRIRPKGDPRVLLRLGRLFA
jgi:Ribonucleotide reductase, small chain/SCP-2 sterol transfer family